LPVLTITQLEKSYGPQVILRGVTASIHTGERVGVVGNNGSGKSTLAKILAGAEVSDSGVIARRRSAKILHLEQEPVFPTDQKIRDIVAEGLGEWWTAKSRYESLNDALAQGTGDLEQLLEQQTEAAGDVERLGGWEQGFAVDALLGHLNIPRPDDAVGTLSGGERRRVALARLLIANPDLAILDEPTNHLDVETIEWLENYLIDEFKGAILLITHDRYLLDRVAQRTWELNRGELFSYDGGYELYLEAKAEREEIAARTESNRQNFLRTELEWLRRQPKARGTKQKARIERAETAIKAVPMRKEERAKLALEASRSGKTILELQSVGIHAYDKTLVKQCDLYLTKGQRLGIIGRNGTGKTTLLKTILGDIVPTSGNVVLGTNTKIAYFDQHRMGLEEDKSIFDNVSGGQTHVRLGSHEMDMRAYLERFLFDPHKQRQPVASLSGGERARVTLAKLLKEGGNLIILDEPTNDLDVATLSALEELLVTMDGSAIVVTHDRWFLNRVATSILMFEGDGDVTLYQGNYEMVAALRQQEKEEAEVEAKIQRDTAKKGSQRPAKPKGLNSAQKAELSGITDDIDEAEQEVATIEQQLADPKLYEQADGQEVARLTKSLEEARKHVEALMLRWEELEALQRALQESNP
jgi:ABC transport system ATP-binding/permease protein